jgi:lipid A ethanolaminephosphotransferase
VRGALFGLGFAACVALLTTSLLTLWAWPRLIKPAIAALLLSAALGAHFMGAYGVVIDTNMITNVLQTHPGEVRDLLSLPMLWTVLLLAVLPLWVVWRLPVQRLSFGAQAGRNLLAGTAALTVLAVLVIAFFADFSTTMRNHRSMRYLINPVNSLYALVDLAHQSQAQPSGPPVVIGSDAHLLPRPPGTKPPLLVLVVGETARADHFSLNGYARPTNPELAALDVLSFRNVMSCGTNTAASLPCMFSHLGKVGFESRQHEYENLLDVAQRAGLAVLWLDNQAGCKGVCARVPNAQARLPAPGAGALPAHLCEGRPRPRRVAGHAPHGQPRPSLFQAQPR